MKSRGSDGIKGGLQKEAVPSEASPKAKAHKKAAFYTHHKKGRKDEASNKAKIADEEGFTLMKTKNALRRERKRLRGMITYADAAKRGAS